jgi:hypothetical protein
MTRVDDEIECPACHALVNVVRPLGVEFRVTEAPSYTSEGGSVTVAIGGDVVHQCRSGGLRGSRACRDARAQR